MAVYNNYQLSILKQLQQLMPKKRFIVANMGLPYLYANTPNVNSYILSYSWRNESQDAIARTILGKLQPVGHLPVTIPGYFKTGYGLSYTDKKQMAQKTAR